MRVLIGFIALLGMLFGANILIEVSRHFDYMRMLGGLGLFFIALIIFVACLSK